MNISRPNKRLSNTDFEMLRGTQLFQNMFENHVILEDQFSSNIRNWLHDNMENFYYPEFRNGGSTRVYFASDSDLAAFLLRWENSEDC